MAKIHQKQLLSRRQINERFATFGMALPYTGAMLLKPLSASASVASASADLKIADRTVRFQDGTLIGTLGQGSWHLGQGRHPPDVERSALRTGLSLGMTLIDTSGNYAEGRSELLINKVIARQRNGVFLVSKVEAEQVTGDGIARACEASLARLGTSYLDLYLLHWPVPNTQFAGLIAAFERLLVSGKIRAWGVSNFNVRQMEELFNVPGGGRCATNQVGYSLSDRGIERDLLPWCAQHNLPVMAYSPLGGDGGTLVRDPTLNRIGAAHGCSAAAVALAWAIRSGRVIAIPESGTVAHVKENAVALSVALAPQELQILNAAF